MSKNNIFRTNSRFAVLSETNVNEVKNEKKNDNKSDKPKINNFKVDKNVLDTERQTYTERPVYTERPTYTERPVYTERPTYTERPVYTERPTYNNESNIFSQKVVDKAQKQRKENELKNTIDEINKSLSIDNFPELKVSNKKSDKNTQTLSVFNFSEKLKPVVTVEENQDTKQIPYGWAVITRDKTTNKSVIKYNKDYENDIKKTENAKSKNWPMKVLDSLVDLYEIERDKYINKWGYDTYEEKYLDPDYDYEYFDKLDEAYESETEEEYEEDYEEDYIEQNKYYWKY